MTFLATTTVGDSAHRHRARCERSPGDPASTTSQVTDQNGDVVAEFRGRSRRTNMPVPTDPTLTTRSRETAMSPTTKTRLRPAETQRTGCRKSGCRATSSRRSSSRDCSRPCATPTRTFRTTRRSSTRSGVHPDDIRSLDDVAEAAVHDQSGPARELSVRDVRGSARADRAHPRVIRHHRAADRRRLHHGRPRQLGRPGRALAARIRRAPGHAHPQRLRLRPVHRRTRARTPESRRSARPSSRCRAARPSSRCSSSATSSRTSSCARRRTC